jgi:hypothetical protein
MNETPTAKRQQRNQRPQRTGNGRRTHIVKKQYHERNELVRNPAQREGMSEASAYVPPAPNHARTVIAWNRQPRQHMRMPSRLFVD